MRNFVYKDNVENLKNDSAIISFSVITNKNTLYLKLIWIRISNILNFAYKN